MLEDGKIFIGKSTKPEYLDLRLANRHGLVTGATGTGKTVSLQVLAEGFSNAGVPVFAADIKGDLSGMAAPGNGKEPLVKRAKEIGIEYVPDKFPVVFWTCSASRDIACGQRFPRWGRCFSLVSSISTIRRKASSTSRSASPTSRDFCCST
jgi:hypothetical protein